MKKLPFTDIDSPVGTWILCPETDADKKLLLEYYDDRGVSDRVGFSKCSITGTLIINSSPQWESDGAMKVEVSTQEGTIAVWFWLVEIEDDVIRRPWLSKKHDVSTACPWD